LSVIPVFRISRRIKQQTGSSNVLHIISAISC